MVKRSSPVLKFRKVKPFVKGLAAGLITALLLTALSAALFTAAKAPDGADELLGFFTLAAACFVSGLFTGGGKGKNGFFWGAVGGAIIFMLCCTASLIIGSADGTMVVPKLLVCLISGCIGGIVGVNVTGERY